MNHNSCYGKGGVVQALSGILAQTTRCSERSTHATVCPAAITPLPSPTPPPVHIDAGIVTTCRSHLPIDILWVPPNIPRDILLETAVDTSLDLLQGTLDLLVLKTLSWGPAHGYDVARWIQDVTGDVLRVEEGSLYPALHRLEKRKLLKSSWGLSRNNRRAKYYEITTKGRAALASEASTWSSFTKAVTTVMTSTDRPAWAK
jgi:PadR family transcriptional regulator, regulatory protein PadR